MLWKVREISSFRCYNYFLALGFYYRNEIFKNNELKLSELKKELQIFKQELTSVKQELIRNKKASKKPPGNRTWTSINGNTMTAAMQDADYKTVRLLNEENKLFSVPVEKLCEEDKDFILDYLKSKKELLDFKPDIPKSNKSLN